MEDPIRNHPTRAEQLDILVSVAAAYLKPGDRVLDLGIGIGYVARLLARRVPDLAFTGFDLKADALETARDSLAGRCRGLDLAVADLSEASGLPGSGAPWRLIYTALTFHDLSDPAKQALISWCAGKLAPDGLLLIYDRLRLTRPGLFRAQQAIWARIEREHGRGMRDAASFEAYLEDLGETNRPAALDDYTAWLEAAGLEAAPLHLHGNIALIGAVPGGR